eukprot:CAMPEP_0168619046 /NCGR_PEP_ID=MMETSP0449_2-20121227/6395_1 /TAXON_ID=1082188 /ORGANISM="Strombidium rassoulzadegani, Strain ras09" /LENGTH=67 /DNA_ID=CAMNT_0008659959 /DNA_START=80 /DNA_END=283 /DNA_ORIENTATION=+
MENLVYLPYQTQNSDRFVLNANAVQSELDLQDLGIKKIAKKVGKGAAKGAAKGALSGAAGALHLLMI